MNKKTTSQYTTITKYILYAILLFTPLARGSIYPWHHAVIQLAALLILVSHLLDKLRTTTNLIDKTPLDKPIAALLLLFCLSSVFSVSKTDSAEAFSLLVSYIIFFYATIHLCRTRNNQRELVYAICIIGSLPALIAYLKALGAIPFSLWQYADINYPTAFFSGVFGNHNHLAGYLEMIIPIILSLFLTKTRRGTVKAVMICWVLFFVVCHILALSRGGWFSLGTALLFMTVVLLTHKRFKKKKLLLAMFSTGCIVAFFVLSGSNLFERVMTMTEEQTMLGMNGRVLIWQGTLEMVKSYPVLGAGPGTFATIFPQFQPPGTTARFFQAHNDYLQLISELGLLFVPLLCWMLYELFRCGFKKLRSRSRQKWGFSLGAMTGIFAILIHSFIDFNLHIPANATLFVVLAAIVVSTNSRVELPLVKRK